MKTRTTMMILKPMTLKMSLWRIRFPGLHYLTYSEGLQGKVGTYYGFAAVAVRYLLDE
jgi:hypothetical protein